MKFPIPSPKSGQTRTIKKFAWIPQEISDTDGNRYTVWLEFYNVIQVFVEGQEYVTREWREVERRVRK